MAMAFDATADLSDEALLALYARGDAAAARQLTLRLTPKVMAHAWRLTGDRDEAADIAQEAMLRLWRIAPRWQPGRAQVTTWLYRVVANLGTDRLRRRRAVTLDAAPDVPDPAPSPEARMGQDQRMAALRGALDALPDRQRQAVVLRHLEGLSNPEIAAVMDIGVEAVESLTARGRRALKEALGPRREDLGLGDDG
jgi:RNA polymerase sigma-70 factor (ECF subfamily)